MIRVLENLFPHRGNLGGEAPGWNSFYNLLSQRSRSASGVMVSAESAMRQATVYACIRVLAETMASFPGHVYKRTTRIYKDLAPAHNLNKVFSRAPNRWQTPFEFKEMMMGHLALRGNCYARIISGPLLGAVQELWPLHPDKVKVQQLDNMRLKYIWTTPQGAEMDLTQDQVFHVRGLSSDGIVGLNPIALLRDTLGNALAAERYQGKLFEHGVNPTGYLKGPVAMKPEHAKEAQQTFMEAYSGEENWHKPMVLWGGLEWNQIGMTNADSQFMDQRRMSRDDICGAFRMPPTKIGNFERATFSNVEEINRNFAGDTMLPWARRWEEAIARDLITDDDQYYFRFNFEGLLRGNEQARTAFYQSAINSGWMTPNEVRELEDMPPDPNGGKLLVQGAIVTLDSIVNPPDPPPVIVQQVLPPEEPEEKEESEEDDELRAVERGERLGELNVYKAEVAAKAHALALKDQEASAAREASRVANLRIEELSGKLVDAITRGNSTAEELQAMGAARAKAVADALEATDKCERIDAQRKILETDLSALTEQHAKALQVASEATSRLQVAAEDNARLIEACAARMLEIEVQAIERALRKPSGLSGLDKFYEKHAERMTAALGPLIQQRQLLCECQPAESVVTQHVAESKRMLLECIKGPQESVSERVSSVVAGWSDRAAVFLIPASSPEGEHGSNKAKDQS